MPVTPKLIGGRVRTVDTDSGRIATTSNGNARDGGGWPNTPEGQKKAGRQAAYMNESTPKPQNPVLPKPSAAASVSVTHAAPKPRMSASPAKGPTHQSSM